MGGQLEFRITDWWSWNLNRFLWSSCKIADNFFLFVLDMSKLCMSQKSNMLGGYNASLVRPVFVWPWWSQHLPLDINKNWEQGSLTSAVRAAAVAWRVGSVSGRYFCAWQSEKASVNSRDPAEAKCYMQAGNWTQTRRCFNDKPRVITLLSSVPPINSTSLSPGTHALPGLRGG